MKRVIEINVASNRGSTGRIAENIGLTMRASGWECYIAHGSRYCGTSELNDIPIGNKRFEYVHYIKSYLFDAQGLGSKVATREFVKTIDLIKPDIIHLQNIHGYYINYSFLFSYLEESRLPVVWTLHDCWPFTGHCVYFDAVGCGKWRTHCENCPQRKTYPQSIIDRSYINFEKKKKIFCSLDNLTIVPVSDWLSGLVSNSFLSEFPRHVIHNGIDLSVFHPGNDSLKSKLGFQNKKLVLGVADGFGQRKGLDDFVALNKIISPEYQIVLIGASKSEIEKLPKDIVAIPRTDSQSQLAEYYSAADAYVNPTYEDNFPTTNIEALACGTPVITYRTGGSPEAVSPETGIVVEQGDVAGMAEAIREICKNKDFYTVACRKRAEEHFDKDKCFEKYVELYERIAQRLLY